MYFSFFSQIGGKCFSFNFFLNIYLLEFLLGLVVSRVEISAESQQMCCLLLGQCCRSVPTGAHQT